MYPAVCQAVFVVTVIPQNYFSWTAAGLLNLYVTFDMSFCRQSAVRCVKYTGNALSGNSYIVCMTLRVLSDPQSLFALKSGGIKG
jgi:hypothetical protein